MDEDYGVDQVEGHIYLEEQVRDWERSSKKVKAGGLLDQTLINLEEMHFVEEEVQEVLLP